MQQIEKDERGLQEEHKSIRERAFWFAEEKGQDGT